MITVVEPQQHIAKLWGAQNIKTSENFRLMRYVLRIDCDDKVLLHNVVTGQLVVLNKADSKALETQSNQFSLVFKTLVADHFLVPVDYDEHDQVVKMREILRQLNERWEPKALTKYTILPTTACNARCYYCFEQGAKVSTMTENVADDVVKFITDNYQTGTEIVILWFGGEPTVASNRIDQISEGLLKNGVVFSSRMMSNGYLLDEVMVKRAKELWHLTSVRICFDGDRDQYNQVKAYIHADKDPYEKVMANIGHLLEAGIEVNIRMNFDIGNYDRFRWLLEDVRKRFGSNTLLWASAHPIVGEYRRSDGMVAHGDDTWLEKKTLELNDIARVMGAYAINARLPHLEYRGCSAARSNARTITPEGNLVSCLEQFGHDQIIGNIYEGVVNQELAQAWRRFADYDRCAKCVMFPACARLSRCAVKDKCYYYSEYIYQYTEVVKKKLIKEGE